MAFAEKSSLNKLKAERHEKPEDFGPDDHRDEAQLEIIHPFGVMDIAQVIVSNRANGSLIEANGKIVGSRLNALSEKGEGHGKASNVAGPGLITPRQFAELVFGAVCQYVSSVSRFP